MMKNPERDFAVNGNFHAGRVAQKRTASHRDAVGVVVFKERVLQTAKESAPY
jgi:hypothetical protein